MHADRANILLVDDKPSRLLTYEAVLEPLGQNLVRATSGEEALASVAEMEFAAVLLDVSMPGMDGFETASLIHDHPRGTGTPIIFVTGVHVTDLDQRKGYEIGAADYVYVPVVPEILRGKVQVLVELYRQRRELSRLNDRLVSAHAELERAHEQLKADNTRVLQRLNRSLEAANTQLQSEIDERRRAEERLREEVQRKDEFISILAHELRNPLSAIQSGVEILRLPGVPEGRTAWARELLDRQVTHLVRLIDDLLDVSRVSTGRIDLQRRTLVVSEIVEESIDATRPLIVAKGHEVRVELPEEPVYVKGDPVRLTQVFGNLLSNAARYMDDGGLITVSVEQAPGSAVVRVRDRGAGLPGDMLERVFELFAQADSSGSRGRGGLGIGLALVRNLVQLHGGRVRAASDGPGCGSEFVVELPVSEAAPASVEREDAPPRQGAPLRVLIIDDNSDAAESLALYFSVRSSHDLRVARDGTSGFAAAIEFHPDAVLLDIGLPDIDGYEVARRLRRLPGFERVPLIALTGFGEEPYRRRAREAGFDHFLLKPVAAPALDRLLADLAIGPGCTARGGSPSA